MRILHINSCNFGSTGNIMLQLAQQARAAGHVVYTSCPDSRDNRKKEVEHQIWIGNRLNRNIHRVLAYYTGLDGCFSAFATRKFLNKIGRLKIDLIHFHNLHGSYLNMGMLFRYIKKHNIRVIWTLHDCWSFTGHCPYFDMASCAKWKTSCKECSQFRAYPASAVDNANRMHKYKKKWFKGVHDLTIVTPSAWLAELTRQSFLQDYPVRVIHNGIDLSVFNPIVCDVRSKYGIEEKYLVLGVAFGWEDRKGLDVFLELERRLGKDYRIMLVGTDEQVDRLLPSNMISVHRTSNQIELAQLYTAADVFVNPTREDNFPTVNMESLACGTPVITFNTGGSPEMIDENSGTCIDKDDIDATEKEIRRICTERPYTHESCVRRARNFDRMGRFNEYIRLYGKEDIC